LLQKLPAGHGAGHADPATHRVPFEHGVDVADPATQKLPGGHKVGAAEPATQKLPAGHTPHVALPVRVVLVHVGALDTVNPASHVGWHEPGANQVFLQLPTVPFVGASTLVPLHAPLRMHVLGGPLFTSSHTYAN